MDDPILLEIQNGYVPREMEEPGVREVAIQLVNKEGDDYVPPPKKVVPFEGGGQRLGSTSSDPAPSASAPAPSVDTAAATTVLAVDPSQPQVSIQVRLHDGTRLVAKFNESHTVGDLRTFVRLSRPQTGAFSLSTTFPKEELADDAKTVKEANLGGAVVVQKLL
mmetsp:Transcript_5147/g.12401  ORF Transcript_5147/g.12401 Transcript_5147/m.12401 type:complete len:164 (+) Transcript_5147:918-1409(+)